MGDVSGDYRLIRLRKSRQGAGSFTTDDDYDTFIGAYAGSCNTTGGGDVFLGYGAGQYETGSNRLYLDNSSTTTPLIYGEFDTNKLTLNGNLPALVATKDRKGLSAMDIVAVLTKVVQQQQKVIDELAEEVRVLKSEWKLKGNRAMAGHVGSSGYRVGEPR